MLFNAILGPDPDGFGRAAPARYDADEIQRRWDATTAWVDEADPDVH